MTDTPDIIVTVEEDALAVVVDSGTPEVTITNLSDPADVTVVSASPVEVVITDQKPIVNVNLGLGGLFDKTDIMGMLEDSLDIGSFTPEMQSDIYLLRDLWSRLGDDVERILLEADVDSIIQTSMSYTDEKIQLTAINLAALDGNILAQIAAIVLTASNISLQVTELDKTTSENFTAQDARIDITAANIASTVLRLDVAENRTTEAFSAITQTADSITSEVTAREATDFLLTEVQSLVTQTANSITQEIASREYLEGVIVAEHTSLIEQTNNKIALEVSARETWEDDTYAELDSKITQTATSITNEVAARTTLENGVIAEHSSLIAQTAESISQEIAARELQGADIVSNTSKITQTAEALVTTLTSVSDLTGVTDSYEERITATEQITSVLSEGFLGSAYSIKAIEHLTANSYGVTVTETTAGIPYVSGFELIVHPPWVAGTAILPFHYGVGDAVEYSDGKIYSCILEHDGDVTNSPGSTAWNLYWEVLSNSAKSAFNVKAEYFHVITPDGVVPLFSVNGVTEEVTINAALVVQRIESLDYAEQDPSKSWFVIDPITGEAEFNNVSMTFGSSEELQTFQDSVGITDNTIIPLLWSGSQAIKNNVDLVDADSWEFNSTATGGAMIEIEVGDDFTGELMVALNEEILTVDTIGDQDWGDVSQSTTGFVDETPEEGVVDLSSGSKSINLEGLF